MTLRLLIHVPEAGRAKTGFKMALNFLKTKGEGEELAVRVLFNAQGVTILREGDEELAALLRDLVQAGGEVFFCENALRAFEVPRDLVPPEADTVPAGIRALVEWQDEGFRYVRA